MFSYLRERWVVIVLSKAINLGEHVSPIEILQFYCWSMHVHMGLAAFASTQNFIIVLDFEATDLPLYIFIEFVYFIMVCKGAYTILARIGV